MKSYNYTDARKHFASILTAVDEGEISRRGQGDVVVISEAKYAAYKESKLDAEFDAIMNTHGAEIKKLADR